MNSTLSKVSLNPKHHYKTQTTMWGGAQVTGMLTDKKIEEYQLAGRYGKGVYTLIKSPEKKKKHVKVVVKIKKPTSEQLLKMLLGGSSHDA